MANTVTKIKDLTVISKEGKWVEIVDPSTNLLDFITTAVDVLVTDEDSNEQEYRVVMSDRHTRPNSNLMVFELEYYIKTGLGTYILDSVIPHKVTKNNYVDTTDPNSLVWLKGQEAYIEELDENGDSYDPKQYTNELKPNVLAESNFFVKTFGIGTPTTGQFVFEYDALFNQAVRNLS